MPPENRYVALYCRISRDRRGHEEGVDTQEKWGREYAAQMWPTLPIRVFKDNNLSAANDGPRPGYIELRAAIARGEVAQIWVVEQSRLERRERGWFDLRDELKAAGIREIHTRRGGIVTVRNVATTIKAVLDADEVATIIERTRDRVGEIATEGRPGGGKPFGYRYGVTPKGKATYTVDPAQADAVRFAAAKILVGWSLSKVAKELTEQGFVGTQRRHTYEHRESCPERCRSDRCRVASRPTLIRPNTVRSMVTNYAVAGLRVHKEGTEDERVIPGVWEPILDRATWEEVRAVLGESRVVTWGDKGRTYRLTAARRPAPRKTYLLTGGLAVCGVCGAPLTASLKQLHGQKDNRKPYYLCHPKQGGRACVGILGDELEQYVAQSLIEALNNPDFLKGLKGDDGAARREELTAALAAIDAERNDIARLRGLGEIEPDEWQSLRSGLTERAQRLHAELEALPRPRSIIDPAKIATSWEHLAVDERRAALSMFVTRVTVNRARPGTKAFDPGRVIIGGLD